MDFCALKQHYIIHYRIQPALLLNKAMGPTESVYALRTELKNLSDNITLTYEVIDLVNELIKLRDEQIQLMEHSEKPAPPRKRTCVPKNEYKGRNRKYRMH